MEAIVADLDTRRHDFHVAIENWQHDFNIGTIVRTANAFLAAEVHIVGNRRWNRRGAMVTDRYQHVRHHADAADLAAYLHERDVRAARHRQPARARAHLETMERAAAGLLPVRPGGPGPLGAARARSCDGTFSIAQFGSTRSINASRGRRDRDARLGPRVRRPVRRRRLARLTACDASGDPGRAPVRRRGRRAASRSPRELWLLTVPSLMPSSARSRRPRARASAAAPPPCAASAGSAWSASNSAERSSTGSGSRAAAVAARRAPARSRRHGRRDSSMSARTMIGAHVGLLAAVALQPRPRDVQLDQRGLQRSSARCQSPQIGVGDPAQVRWPGRARTRRTPPRPRPSSQARALLGVPLRAKARKASRVGPATDAAVGKYSGGEPASRRAATNHVSPRRRPRPPRCGRPGPRSRCRGGRRCAAGPACTPSSGARRPSAVHRTSASVAPPGLQRRPGRASQARRRGERAPRLVGAAAGAPAPSVIEQVPVRRRRRRAPRGRASGRRGRAERVGDPLEDLDAVADDQLAVEVGATPLAGRAAPSAAGTGRLAPLALGPPGLALAAHSGPGVRGHRSARIRPGRRPPARGRRPRRPSTPRRARSAPRPARRRARARRPAATSAPSIRAGRDGSGRVCRSAASRRPARSVVVGHGLLLVVTARDGAGAPAVVTRARRLSGSPRARPRAAAGGSSSATDLAGRQVRQQVAAAQQPDGVNSVRWRQPAPGLAERSTAVRSTHPAGGADGRLEDQPEPSWSASSTRQKPAVSPVESTGVPGGRQRRPSPPSELVERAAEHERRGVDVPLRAVAAGGDDRARRR